MSHDNEYALGDFQPTTDIRGGRWGSPIVVAHATDNIIGMLQSGQFEDPQMAINYLNEETLGFLSRAKQGSKHYNDSADASEGFDLQTREAFGLTLVTFGEMRKSKIPGFDLTFSRRGMLRAPDTADQASQRIDEMEMVIRRIARGGRAPKFPSLLGETSIPEFRTLAFFRMAHSIPLREERSA